MGQTVSPPRKVFRVLRALRTDCKTSLVVSYSGQALLLNSEAGISDDGEGGLEEPADDVSEVLSRSFQCMAEGEES